MTTYPFDKVIEKTTLLGGLVFSFLYLRQVAPLNRENLGFLSGGKSYSVMLIQSFAAGTAILTCLILSLLWLDIYAIHSGRDITFTSVTVLIIKALFTGLAVGVIEETLFRGALFTGLMKRTNAIVATLAVSFVYSAAHFIDYKAPVKPDDINWLTAPDLFLETCSGIFNLQVIDAMAALFLLGILFSLVRLRTGNIIQCIGLHAGLVAAIKISRYFTQYVPDNNFTYMVSSHDHRLGWLAAF